MRAIPRIGRPGGSSDFHDSSLIALEYLPIEESLVVVLSTPNECGLQELWQVRLGGVLEMQLATLGNGEPPETTVAPEVYDVFDDPTHSCAKKWRRRLRKLGISEPEVHVVTFASSFLRGWGSQSYLEGIRVVCRRVTVERAPSEYRNTQGYSRARIKGHDWIG